MECNPYTQYRRTLAETARPGDLVVMLYRGAIRFTSQGILAIEAGQTEAAHTALVRAQDILAELHASLDLSTGPIAASLASLYVWASQRLQQANVRKEAGAAQEVADLLRELLPAWEQAARKADQATPDQLAVSV